MFIALLIKSSDSYKSSIFCQQLIHQLIIIPVFTDETGIFLAHWTNEVGIHVKIEMLLIKLTSRDIRLFSNPNFAGIWGRRFSRKWLWMEKTQNPAFPCY